MTSRFLSRPLSYSQLSAFEHDPNEWYCRYILNVPIETNAEMLFGVQIGDAIGTPNNPIPNLNPPGVKEYPLFGEIQGIKLIGYADHLCDKTWELHENKTSYNYRRWTQSKVDQHKQFTMYAYLIYQTHGVSPEKMTMYLNFITCRLVGINYALHNPPKWKQFQTQRTKQDLIHFQDYVLKIVEAMQRYIDTKALSTPPPRPPVFRKVL